NGAPALNDTKSFTVVVTELNSPPTLTVPPDQTIPEIGRATCRNTASDPDLPANSLTFSLLSGPPGVHLDSAMGLLTWTPTEAQGPSTNLVAVRVTDNGTPALKDTKSFTVVVTELNSPPTLTVPPDQTIPELSTLTVTNTASDADLPANSLTFSLLSEIGRASRRERAELPAGTPAEAQGPSTHPI